MIRFVTQMCIRDSYNNEKQEAANDDYRKKLEDAGVTFTELTDEERAQWKEASLSSVSYTHLDVYKRQACSMSSASRSGVLPKDVSSRSCFSLSSCPGRYSQDTILR